MSVNRSHHIYQLVRSCSLPGCGPFRHSFPLGGGKSFISKISIYSTDEPKCRVTTHLFQPTTPALSLNCLARVEPTFLSSLIFCHILPHTFLVYLSAGLKSFFISVLLPLLLPNHRLLPLPSPPFHHLRGRLLFVLLTLLSSAWKGLLWTFRLEAPLFGAPPPFLPAHLCIENRFAVPSLLYPQQLHKLFEDRIHILLIFVSSMPSTVPAIKQAFSECLPKYTEQNDYFWCII